MCQDKTAGGFTSPSLGRRRGSLLCVAMLVVLLGGNGSEAIAADSAGTETGMGSNRSSDKSLGACSETPWFRFPGAPRVYQFVPGEIFVVGGPHLLKVSNTGGSGHNMFAARQECAPDIVSTLPGFTFLVGHQLFSHDIVDLDYVDGYTLVTLGNGSLLKINATGGSGEDMFAVDELSFSSCAFKARPNSNHYVGSHRFATAILGVAPVPGYLLINFADGTLLKVAGTGGSGCNLFSLEAAGPCGFRALGSSSSYVGSHTFSSSVNNIEYLNGFTFVSFANGKLLKVNGSGGSGCNLFAIQETSGSCGFSGVAGYNYYVGSQKFTSPIVGIRQVGSYLFFSFLDGRLLKINGSGGSGCNLFAIQEETGICGFRGFSGYSHYSGSYRFSARVTSMALVGNHTLMGFADGRLLKVTGAGSSGCNPFAIQETNSCGFSGINGYDSYAGSDQFTVGVTHIRQVGSSTFVGFGDGRLLKVKGSGGSGCNPFAVEETATRFSGLPNYDFYVGDQ